MIPQYATVPACLQARISKGGRQSSRKDRRYPCGEGETCSMVSEGISSTTYDLQSSKIQVRLIHILTYDLVKKKIVTKGMHIPIAQLLR